MKLDVTKRNVSGLVFFFGVGIPRITYKINEALGGIWPGNPLFREVSFVCVAMNRRLEYEDFQVRLVNFVEPVERS